MAKVVWQGFVLSPTNGKPVSGAEIRVFDADSGLATTLYSDRAGGAWTDGNPFFTGPDGFVQFYVDPKRIRVEAYEGSQVAQFDDVLVGTVDDGGIVTANLADGAVTRQKLNFNPVEYVDDVAALRAMTGMVSGQSVQVLGYNAAGDNGGGVFHWSSADESTAVGLETSGYWGVTIPPTSDATGASGAWKRKDTSNLSPFMFGCVGDGATDDALPLQAFFSHMEAVDYSSMNVAGSFATTVGITYGSDVITPQTSNAAGHFRLTAISAIPRLFSMQDAALDKWEQITLTGTGSTSFASRTCEVGLYLFDCGRTDFGKIRAVNFAYAGVYVGNLNTLVDLGNVKVNDCGTGSPSYSLTGNWSNPVNSGSSGSVAQRTVVDVDTLPPSYILSEDYGLIGDSQYFARIDGRLHYITSIDDVAGTIQVFPWVKSTATPGSFEYVFGGGVVTRGSDCNVLRITMVDAIRCGVALGVGSLYGPSVKRVVTQLCGSGLLIGNDPGGACLGGEYGGLYFENNQEDIVLVMRAGTNAYNYFTSEYALDLSLSYCAGAPLTSSDTYSTSLETFFGNHLVSGGRPLAYEKPSRSATTSSKSLTPTRIDESLVWERDTATFNLQAMDSDINRITGIDSMHLTCLGGGAKNQPTGTLTFNAPSGWTVNGGAGPLTYTSLRYPPIFSIQWKIGAMDVLVSWLNEDPVYSNGATGGTGSAGAGSQYVELEINGTTYKVLHDGTV